MDDLIRSELDKLPAVMQVKEVATYCGCHLSLLRAGGVRRHRLNTIRRSIRIPRQALVDLFERASEHGCE